MANRVSYRRVGRASRASRAGWRHHLPHIAVFAEPGYPEGHAFPVQPYGADSVSGGKPLRLRGRRNGPVHAAGSMGSPPYDLTFEWSDDKIYCSELVWKVYERAL